MSKPLVSILLPSLNARSFLQPRIESILAQTFSDWEAIVLDSHSTDGSWEIFQSIAATDARFRLYQIPADGLYAALNRGLDLAEGEFIHIATCDDTMAPEFLSDMLGAFDHCPEAGLAVCNMLAINRHGNELALRDVSGRGAKRGVRNLLALDVVRTAFPGQKMQTINYRPVPHDCLLHFAGRSVYCSLNQLLIRSSATKAVGPFDTHVGSVADFGWLLRLTSTIGSVHLPKKLAMWRYHGKQLSFYKDDSRPGFMRKMAERTLQDVCKLFPTLLDRNDKAALLLPFKIMTTRNVLWRVYYWFEGAARLARMAFERPAPTLRGLRRVKFRFWMRRYFLLPMIFEGLELAPEKPEDMRFLNN